MPCTSGPSFTDTLQEDLDDVTDKLCWVLSNLDDTTWLRKDVKSWWKEHQAKDARKKAQELELERMERLRDENELERLKKKLGKT